MPITTTKPWSHWIYKTSGYTPRELNEVLVIQPRERKYWKRAARRAERRDLCIPQILKEYGEVLCDCGHHLEADGTCERCLLLARYRKALASEHDQERWIDLLECEVRGNRLDPDYNSGKTHRDLAQRRHGLARTRHIIENLESALNKATWGH